MVAQRYDTKGVHVGISNTVLQYNKVTCLSNTYCISRAHSQNCAVNASFLSLYRKSKTKNY